VTGEKMTLPAMLSHFDEQLSWLSQLQQHYEWTADHERHSDATEEAATALSAAVGRFLAEYGHEAML
jgi:hypothetical protein